MPIKCKVEKAPASVAVWT